ncbi:MAG: hypothetical protein AB1705_07465 [Verrucomicrobiota bacterium]
MKTWKIKTVMVWLGALAAGGNLLAAEVKLAVVPSGREEQPLADLLVARLSNVAGVALAERGEIERVLKEQALGAANKPDFVKLGSLLKVDGLLSLEPATAGNSRFLVARLVAVRQGVVLGILQSPWPLPDRDGWIQLVAQRFEGLFPKAGVLPRDTVAVSVLNLRSAIPSRGSEILERELTVLLTHRLAARREWFVLERQKMADLVAELGLTGVDDTAFWSGSHVLEGGIDPGGVNGEELTVNLRLAPPDRNAEKQITVTGRRAQLVELVEQIVAQLTPLLSPQAGQTAWEPQAEATRYLEEAKWALRWKVYGAAQTAGEAAWALGKRDAETALIRMQSYAEATVTSPTPSWRTYSNKPGVTYAGPLVTRSLDHAARALDLFLENTRQLPRNDEAEQIRWHGTGVDVIEAASHQLRHYYLAPRPRTAAEDERLQGLRARVREAADLIRQEPALAGRHWTRNRSEVLNVMPSPDRPEEKNFFRIATIHGALWHETATDAVAMYRDLARQTPFLFHVTKLVRREAYEPRLAVWSRADDSAGLWAAFVDELRASAEVTQRVLGALLHLELVDGRNPAMEAALQERARALADLLTPLLDEFSRDEGKAALMRECVQRIAAKCGEGNPTDAKRRVRAEIHGPLAAKVNNLRASAATDQRAQEEEAMARAKQAAAAKKEEQDRPKIERMQNYLRTAKAHESRALTEVFMHRYSEAQAREMLPLVQQYAKRVGANPATTNIQTKLVNILNPPVASVQPVAPPAATLPAQSKQSLTVRRFWQPPVQTLPNRKVDNLSLTAVAWRGNRLWAQVLWSVVDAKGFYVTNPETGETPLSAAIYSLDLATFQSEAIPFVPNLEAAMGPWRNVPKLFEVHQDALYLSAGKTLQRYDFSAKRWNALPVPIDRNMRLTSLGGHLYLSSAETILQYDPATGHTRILASTRRRPAQTPLDNLSTLGAAFLFPGPQGLVRVFMGGTVYECQARDGAWKALPGPAGGDLRTGRPHPGPQGVLFTLADGGALRGYGLVNSGAKIEPLYTTYPSQSPGRGSTAGSGRWRFADVAEAESGQYDGTRLWLLERYGVKQRPGRLWHFQSPQEWPVEFSLNFAAPPARTNMALVDFQNAPPEDSFIATPAGLVWVQNPPSGLWFIPQAELDASAVTGFASQPAKLDLRTNKDVGAWSKRLFQLHDTDRDGLLSQNEFQKLMREETLLFPNSLIPGMMPGPGPFPRFDADRNGTLGNAELEALLLDRFKSLERAPGQPGRPTGSK